MTEHDDLERLMLTLSELAYDLVGTLHRLEGQSLDPKLASSLRHHVLEPLRDAAGTLDAMTAHDW